MKKLNFSLLLLTICQWVWAQKPLKLNFEMGKTYTQKHHSQFDLAQDVMGMHVITNVDMVQNMDFKVQNFENDVYTLETTIENIVMNTKTQGMDITMDASGDLSNPMNKLVSNLTRKPFFIQMTSKGEIKDVKGLSEILQNITQGVDLPATQREVLKKAIASKMDKAALSQQLNIAGFKYPEQAVKVGDSWTGEFNSSEEFKTYYKSTYTIKEINEDFVICDFKATAVRSDDENDAPQGNFNGQLKLDSKSGWLIDGKGTQDLKGNFTIKNPLDEDADDIQFFMDMNGRFEVTGGVK